MKSGDASIFLDCYKLHPFSKALKLHVPSYHLVAGPLLATRLLYSLMGAQELACSLLLYMLTSPCKTDKWKLSIATNVNSFVCLIRFFTSNQQSFSYEGMGLPRLNQYLARINVLAQGHNAVMPVRLKPMAPQLQVKHSTTEPPKKARQTMQTQSRLLQKQSDQGLPCLLFREAFCEFQPIFSSQRY